MDSISVPHIAQLPPRNPDRLAVHHRIVPVVVVVRAGTQLLIEPLRIRGAVDPNSIAGQALFVEGQESTAAGHGRLQPLTGQAVGEALAAVPGRGASGLNSWVTPRPRGGF